MSVEHLKFILNTVFNKNNIKLIYLFIGLYVVSKPKILLLFNVSYYQHITISNAISGFLG